MSNKLIFTKKVSKSGKGYLVWIPKDIVSFLNLNQNCFVEFRSRIMNSQKYVVFTKKISKSGRGFLVWIPKDISEYLGINKESLLEFKIKLLGKRGGRFE